MELLLVSPAESVLLAVAPLPPLRESFHLRETSASSGLFIAAGETSFTPPAFLTGIRTLPGEGKKGDLILGLFIALVLGFKMLVATPLAVFFAGLVSRILLGLGGTAGFLSRGGGRTLTTVALLDFPGSGLVWGDWGRFAAVSRHNNF